MTKEGLQSFYERFKFIIIPIVIVLVSFILIITVIVPQITRLLANQKIAREISERSKFLEVKAQTLESYNTVELDQKIKAVLNSYPVDRDYVNSLILIQNIISQSGFSITSLTLGASTESGDGQKYNFNISVSGPKDKLSKFLTNIETSYRLMRIASLETSTDKDQQVTVSLNVDVLYAPAPGNFGNVDTPLPQFSQKEGEVLSKLATVESLTNIETAQSEATVGRDNPFE